MLEREIIPPRPIVEEAITYAHNGWPVFPLAGKIPYKGTHGHRDATCDEAVIHALWQEHPGANIGLATGKAAGVLVLDLDPRHNGYESFKLLEETYELIPQTRTARTPHNGLHLYFQHPQDSVYPNTQGLLGEGLDTTHIPQFRERKNRIVNTQDQADEGPVDEELSAPKPALASVTQCGCVRDQCPQNTEKSSALWDDWLVY